MNMAPCRKKDQYVTQSVKHSDIPDKIKKPFKTAIIFDFQLQLVHLCQGLTPYKPQKVM